MHCLSLKVAQQNIKWKLQQSFFIVMYPCEISNEKKCRGGLIFVLCELDCGHLLIVFSCDQQVAGVEGLLAHSRTLHQRDDITRTFFCQYRCILQCKSWKGARKSCVVAYPYTVHGFGAGQHVIECVLCPLKVLQQLLVMDLSPTLLLTDLQPATLQPGSPVAISQQKT